jgi:outer membrane murein-binding lipoprotein Lpp
MRKMLKTFGIVAMSGLMLAGCASVAHVEKDKSVDLNNYQTFAWVETKENQNDSVKTKVSDLTERTIKEVVNEELEKAGWKQSKKPDVLLTYDVMVERTVKEQNNPVYSQPQTRYYYNPYSRRWIPVYYPSQFLGYDRDQQQVREGTITIGLIDAKTDKTIWQGWTTDEVASRNFTAKEIRNGVKSIFRKFDVAKN